MTPRPCFSMIRAAAVMVMKYDLTRLKAAYENCSSVSSMSLDPTAIFVPMRLKEMSSFPARVTISCRCSSTDFGSRASTPEAVAEPPAFEISVARASREAIVRPARKTFAPSRANVFAIVLPTPPPAPYTTATFPASNLRLGNSYEREAHMHTGWHVSGQET